MFTEQPGNLDCPQPLITGGTPLNNPLIDFCALLSKSKLIFNPMWQYFDNFLLILWKLHS